MGASLNKPESNMFGKGKKINTFFTINATSFQAKNGLALSGHDALTLIKSNPTFSKHVYVRYLWWTDITEGTEVYFVIVHVSNCQQFCAILLCKTTTLNVHALCSLWVLAVPEKKKRRRNHLISISKSC